MKNKAGRDDPARNSRKPCFSFTFIKRSHWFYSHAQLMVRECQEHHKNRFRVELVSKYSNGVLKIPIRPQVLGKHLIHFWNLKLKKHLFGVWSHWYVWENPTKLCTFHKAHTLGRAIPIFAVCPPHYFNFYDGKQQKHLLWTTVFLEMIFRKVS